MSIDRDKYFHEVINLIQKFEQLGPRTDLNSSIYHRLLGSTIESYKCFLAGIGNSLSNIVDPSKFLKAIYVDDEDLMNVIKLSHRTYFNQLHSSTASVLKEFCDNKSIDVPNNLKAEIMKNVAALKKKMPSEYHGEIDHFASKLKSPKFPQFDDYLNAVIKSKAVNKKQTSTWRKFFRGFSLLRNKVSHESTTLNVSEKQVLVDSGIGVQISENEFLVSFEVYYELTVRNLEFIDFISTEAHTSS